MAVVLLPPPAALEAVEEFRREHDPLFHRIPGHLTVVFPFEGRTEAEALRAARDGAAAAAAGPFEVSLGGAGRFDDGVVYLRVGRGAAELASLHDALAPLFLPPGARPLPYLPHLTVARGTGAAEAEFLERQAAGRLPTVRFDAEVLTLVVEDARGLWLARGTVALQSP